MDIIVSNLALVARLSLIDQLFFLGRFTRDLENYE
jgi:hypothetical protein